MTEKEIMIETVRALPDDCSIEEIAERVEFMAAVQTLINSIKATAFLTTKSRNNWPHGLQVNWSPAARDDLHDRVVFNPRVTILIAHFVRVPTHFRD
jgi:hypothetical protein